MIFEDQKERIASETHTIVQKKQKQKQKQKQKSAPEEQKETKLQLPKSQKSW